MQFACTIVILLFILRRLRASAMTPTMTTLNYALWAPYCCHFLLICATIEYTTALTSCAPPRFDVFSEKIAASWHTAARRSQTDVQVAEEVMRSCGGAVQGVRDVPLVSSLYLNRADDGFVFFDCGSYTHGSVKIDDTAQIVMTTSLMLSAQSRVLVSCIIDPKDKIPNLNMASMLHRVKFGDDRSSLRQEDFVCSIMKEAPCGIRWHRQQHCRMSSPGQPWMMQRVKWEENVYEEETVSDFQPFGSIQTWTSVASGSEGKDEADPLAEANDWTCTVGSICTKTGYIKATVRKYNENGVLARVALQTGRVEL